MDWLPALGALLAVGGLAGYVAGVFVDYPGRAFSVTALMVGVTVFLVAQGAPTSDRSESR
jgi:hypothetical protein